MVTINDFIEKYEAYSDEELLDIKNNIDGYSEEAKEAFNIVLKNRGGIERLEENLLENNKLSHEIKRIKFEVDKLSSKETNADFIKTLVSSQILTKEQVDIIVDERFGEFQAYKMANAVTSKTILLAIIGIILSGVVSGVLWRWVITQSDRIPIFILLTPLVFCYFVIIFITKKPKDSPIVIISAMIAFIVAIIIGEH
jgi:hypothetical protein